VNVFSEPALRLSQLQEGGLLTRLGLHEGDLLFRMDGQPLVPSDLEALADRVAEPGRTVRLRVYREASFQELTFVVERQ
jgi:C-terminal processing protease CtpA/Prc